MNAINFQRALKFTLNEEGGVSDDKNDPGGLTNLGILYTEWNAYKSALGRPPSTRKEFSKYLTVQDVTPIYQKNYWNKMNCDAFPYPIAAVLFDTAVNMGVGEARIIQRRTDSKGITNPVEYAYEFLQDRLHVYKLIVNNHPEQKDFLKGWLNRVRRLRKEVSI